jgi:5'-3' exonuclease
MGTSSRPSFPVLPVTRTVLTVAASRRYGVGIQTHLIDGTYELFRHFFGVPSHVNQQGKEVAAVRGVLSSVLGLLADGATHVGVATDHVIESFRNDMWPGYKTSAGVDPRLLGQFDLLEAALFAMGVVVWPMVTLEADDALASAAAVAARDPSVEQVVICTPDKDLGQCVVGTRVVQMDRRKGAVIDEQGVRAKFGVGPASIPDYLALVGDSADGFPGLSGWGAKTTATVLARYEHLEAIPDAPGEWDLSIRGVAGLAATLAAQRDLALLFRDLATLRTEPPAIESVEELRWVGPRDEFVTLCEDVLDSTSLAPRAHQVAAGRSPA